VHHQLIKWRGKYPPSSNDYELGILSKLLRMSAYLIFVLSCRYTIIKEVGDGTFGSVWRAIHKGSGEVVCHSACPFFFFVTIFLTQ
jgi:serine/threonine protein kinase